MITGETNTVFLGFVYVLLKCVKKKKVETQRHSHVHILRCCTTSFLIERSHM